MKSRPEDEFQSLYDAFAELETAEEVQRFLTDLCTPGEIEEFVDRWWIVRLLDQKMQQSKISQIASVAPATVTRVRRSLNYGANGYRIVLDRLKGKP